MADRIRRRRSRAAFLPGVLLLATLPASVACGKKGAPLAPLVHVPVAATDFTAKRIGDTVHLQLTVPPANTDGSRPADIEWLTIYGFTGTPVSSDDFIKKGTVVARFPVRKPPPPVPEGGTAPPLPPPTGPGLDQGALAVAIEELTPALHQPILPKAPKRPPPPPPAPSNTVLALPLGGPPAEVPLARLYVSMGTNHDKQKGPFSARLSVPLLQPPSPPSVLPITYTETAVTITWTPPADARQHVQVPTPMPPPAPATTTGTVLGVPTSTSSISPIPSVVPWTATAASPAPVATPRAATPPATTPDVPAATPPVVTTPAATTPAAPAAATPAATSETTAPAAAAAVPAAVVPSRPLSLPSVASVFNVYDVPSPDAKDKDAAAQPVAPTPAAQPGAAQPPPAPLLAPLNAAPLAVATYQDTRMEFGVERCYAVRTVNLYGTLPIESLPSEPVCVTFVDTFPPAAPKRLGGVESPGAISLLWDANAETDLAGYVVLRGEGSGERLQSLMPAPIRDTTFRDTTVKPAVTYFYVVVALDSAGNVSAQSNKVTVTAR